MVKSSSSRDLTKRLIWIYFFLLIFEGALRKWFLTSLSDLLLLSRVPLTVIIYFSALHDQKLVVNAWVVWAGAFAVLTVPMGILAHGNFVVVGYGLVANFLSIPLIFIIPRVMDYSDVEKLGQAMLLMVIPMTVIIGIQFYSPQDAWINRSVGGEVGAGFSGALDRYRPPGTFSFITGVAQFYTLAFAFFLAQFVNHRTLPVWFLILTGAAFVMATYGSISRLLAVSILIVFVLAIIGLILNGRKLHNIFKVGFAVMVFFAIASQFVYFQDGEEAFMARWEQAKGGEEGTATGHFQSRFHETLVAPLIYFDWGRLMGLGLGSGTNVGAKLLTGERRFLAGEGEWFRLKNELGPIVGTGFILFRIALTAYLGMLAYRAMKKGNMLPWLIWSSSFLLIASGQWGQQTTNGFTFLSAGLILGSSYMRSQPKQNSKSNQQSVGIATDSRLQTS